MIFSSILSGSVGLADFIGRFNIVGQFFIGRKIVNGIFEEFVLFVFFVEYLFEFAPVLVFVAFVVHLINIFGHKPSKQTCQKIAHTLVVAGV